MPIFQNDNNHRVQPIAPIEDKPDANINVEFDTASYYKNFQETGDIIIALSGFPDTITYYSKLMGNDDIVTNAGDIVDPTLLQYVRINNFEIRVTQAPEFTLDDSVNMSSVVGEANIYPVITPKIGDVLVKSIRTGNYSWGVFQVTAVTRKSMYKTSAWSITFSQIGYSESIRDRKSDPYVYLEFDFESNNLQKGINPLVPTISVGKYRSRDKLRNDIIKLYYTTFYSKSKGTLLVPTNDISVVYDQFVVKFWNSIVDMKELGDYKQPTEYHNANAVLDKSFTTVFDAYLEQSPMLLMSSCTNMSKISATAFSATYMKNTILVSDIDYLIFPYYQSLSDVTSVFPIEALIANQVDWVYPDGTSVLWSNENKHTKNNEYPEPQIVKWNNPNVENPPPVVTPLETNGLVTWCDDNGNLIDWSYNKLDPLHNTYSVDRVIWTGNSQYTILFPPDPYSAMVDYIIPPLPIVVTATYGNPYIFSLNFYNDEGELSLLETLISKVINNQVILLKDVYLAFEVVKRETLLDQFYHLPFIISLLQVAR